VDLGASSGRVVAGRLSGGRMELRELHRFPNGPLQLPDGLQWNITGLFAAALEGLQRTGDLRGIGVDAWGVDYALLDGRGGLLGLPFHYRDRRTEGMIARAFARVPHAELYARTGIQTLPINTVFQLLAESAGAALAAAERIALVPDLIAFWLCGELGNERTNASTTGLLDAHSGEWANDLIERLGLPVRPFRELAPPGTLLGAALPQHGLGPVPVRAVASHDTASAFVAAPLRDSGSAILSSGTWSLLGLELPKPVLTDAAREANLTNERGVDGTTRLLGNVMGLWLEQECARDWGVEFRELHRLAAEATGEVPLFDPDDDAFLAPGDMPARIADACRRSGQAPAEDRGCIARSILMSLACKYRVVLERLEAVTGQDIERIHVIGGGARHALLCRLTADITGREVLAGPVEATALGNLLVQARAAGELGTLAEVRTVAAASADVTSYEPSGGGGAEETYHRFLALTGLGTPTTV
jgi:rhamnulokinase